MSLVSADVSAAKTAKIAGDDTGVGLSVAETVQDIIYNIDPTETPLFSMLKRGKASGVYHEWLSDTYATPAITSAAEGAAFATDTIDGRTRYANPCMIRVRTYEVSGTIQAVSQYGLKKELSYQAAKKMVEIKRDIESILFKSVSGLDVSGTATSSRETEGFEQLLTATNTAYTGTTAGYLLASMTGARAEVSLNSVMNDIWDNGVKANVVMMLAKVKRQVSRWTGVATKYFEQDKKRLINVIDYYESDFGMVRFVTVRWMTDATVTGTEDSAGAFMIVGNFSQAKVAYLRPLQNIKFGQLVKDSVAGSILTEFALEYGHPGNYGWVQGLTA